MNNQAMGNRQQALGYNAKRVFSHRDLLVWQKGMDLVEEVYRMTLKLPDRERWGLVSQMRRSAVSIPSNIAEGYGRHATGEYRHHLAISRGSLLELETQLLLCRRLHYLDSSDCGGTLERIEELSKMLGALIKKLKE